MIAVLTEDTLAQTRELPSGTLTFVFTDIEGSTNMVRDLGTEKFAAVLDEHGRRVRGACNANDGVEIRTEGDSFFYVFRRPTEAVAAVVAAQKALAAGDWPHGVTVKVRMGLHTGEATVTHTGTGPDYVGFDIHRAARIASSGYGGQVLVSETTQAMILDRLPGDVSLRNLGHHRFKDLARPERVYQLVIPGLPAEFPRIKSLDRTPNNLPTQLTSFVGRGKEVAEARRLLESARLLTLTGPGGTGKTRLSLQIAAEAADAFPDGVFFVALADIFDAALVSTTIAHELGVQPKGSRPPIEDVIEHVKEKKVLLVLDNFEQVLDAASDVTTLLRGATQIRVIVSSRAALRLYGEQEFPVPPLGLPDARSLTPEALSQFEAVRLFIERALAAKPDFAISNDSAPAVAEICSRLDGLPLAIELAAARVRLLSPQNILARLAKSLSLLSGGGGKRDLPARQQTLRGAIAWSYDLLDEPTRRLFRQFSWFSGGAELEDVELVCGETCGGDVLEGMATLVEHSLVRRREIADAPRFFMLLTIREYGLERLAEDPDAEKVKKNHAHKYLELAEKAAPLLMGKLRKQKLDALEEEKDNFRTALEWAISGGETDSALRLGAALWRFWQMRGYLHEGQQALERILAMPDAGRDPLRLAQAVEALGGIEYWKGQMAEAEVHYRRQLELSRPLGDRRMIAEAYYNLSFCVQYRQPPDTQAALAHLRDAVAIYRELGDQPGIAKTQWAMSIAHFFEGDVAVGRKLLEECVPMFRAQGDQFGLGWALHLLGLLEARDGNLDASRRTLSEGLQIFADADDLSGLVLLLDDFSRLEMASGDVERGVRLGAASAAIRESTGTALANLLNEQDYAFPRVAAEADAPAAWADGRSMTRDEAVHYALRR